MGFRENRPHYLKHRVARGESFDKTMAGIQTTVRWVVRPDIALDTLGFRCVGKDQ
jgi:hypothetical protein